MRFSSFKVSFLLKLANFPIKLVFPLASHLGIGAPIAKAVGEPDNEGKDHSH